MIREARTYYGVMIHPETKPNDWGLRWWAFSPKQMLRADTLDGMKRLIRIDLGKEPK